MSIVGAIGLDENLIGRISTVGRLLIVGTIGSYEKLNGKAR